MKMEGNKGTTNSKVSPNLGQKAEPSEAHTSATSDLGTPHSQLTSRPERVYEHLAPHRPLPPFSKAVRATDCPTCLWPEELPSLPPSRPSLVSKDVKIGRVSRRSSLTSWLPSCQVGPGVERAKKVCEHY